MLADLKCGLLLDTPARDVVENVLRRMGIRVVRTLSKLAGGPGPEVDVVFCEAARAMAVDRPGLDLPDPSGLVLLRRTWPQAHGEQGQATSAGVLHLPNPVLRSNLEPLLLGLELQNRLRCVSDMRGSDVAGC